MEQQQKRDVQKEWEELGAAACRHAGISYNSLDVLVRWTEQYCANAIYRIDNNNYLKLFGPTSTNQYYVERAMIELLAERDEIPAPKIVSAGEPPDARPYLILTNIPGQTAEAVWDELPRDQQLAVADNFGEIIAALHALPGGKLVEVERRWGDRRRSTGQFRDLLVERIKATDAVPVRFRAAFVDYLEGEACANVERATTVCHRELAHNHVYLERGSGACTVSGIIDWADGMRGPEEWDIAFIWFWMFSRDREAMSRFLATRYGKTGAPAGLARRSLGAILQMFEWDVFWGEIIERSTGLETDPVQAATDLLFPSDVFGDTELR